ncbi:hypothetical protein [Adhaeribacter aquaticus]|uniref:hypothetical protein n=1 Tax=Adhaeribacter aquaticus TaxID=299567 RepID=UPI0004045FBB|nr:hypothetical protein [Adhaeribacter aquaticus]
MGTISQNADQLLKVSFDIIINRLINTINAYEAGYDELFWLKIDIVKYLKTHHHLPLVEQLENISKITEIKGSTSFFIRKLSSELAIDLQSLINNQDINTQQTIYWQ